MVTLLTAGIFSTLLYPGPVYAQEDTITGDFIFLGDRDQVNRTYPFEYSDRYFEGSAYQSSYDLLRLSLKASMAATLPQDIMDLMDKLGFSYTGTGDQSQKGINVLAGDTVTESIYYPAQTINGVEYINSIGYAIGKKQIGDATVLMVGIRGAAYGIEWGGNFNIGEGEDHEGFLLASDQVMDGIRDFIERERITGKKKVWIFGYSRAAAAANIAGARLTNGEIPDIAPEDVYAYCFECPRTTRRADCMDEKYNNIISIANPADIVPKVGPSAWGYQRYGRSFNLPSANSDADFVAKNKEREEIIKKITPLEIIPAENADHITDVFVNNLAVTAKNPKYYTEVFQQPLMKVAACYLGGGQDKPNAQDLMTLKALEEGIIDLDPQNARAMKELFGSKEGLFDINPYSPLLCDHSMEVTLSWLEEIKGFDDFGPNTYRILYINDPKYFNLYQGDTVLARGDLYHVSLKDPLYFVEYDGNNQAVIVLPEGSEYKLEIIGSTGNILGVSGALFDITLGKETEIKDYGSLALPPGSNVTIEVGKSGLDMNVTREKRGVKVKKEYSGKDLPTYIITAKAEGDGQIIGGGILHPGEDFGFRAIPGDGKKFDGFYIGDRKVSSDPVYRGQAIEDFEITGKFS